MFRACQRTHPSISAIHQIRNPNPAPLPAAPKRPGTGTTFPGLRCTVAAPSPRRCRRFLGQLVGGGPGRPRHSQGQHGLDMKMQVAAQSCSICVGAASSNTKAPVAVRTVVFLPVSMQHHLNSHVMPLCSIQTLTERQLDLAGLAGSNEPELLVLALLRW